MIDPESHLSTTQCAKLSGFSTQTITRQIDADDLKGFRVPGSFHRRVRVRDLVEWLQRHGVPIPDKLRACEDGPQADRATTGETPHP